LLAFVILTIVALALVPIVVDRYTRPIYDEVRTVTEPSRGLVTELQLALALQGSILHDLFDTGDTVLIGRYREARQRETIANERLARLTGRLGPRVQDRYDSLRQLERRWHGLVEQFLTPRATDASMSDPLQAQLYEDVLVAVAQLDDALEIATRERRQRILDADRLQRRTTVVLGVAALAALAAVIWLGARLQDYAAATERARRALERAMDSKERLMRGISHDLKNPLNAIEGHAALLEDGIVGELAERQRHSVKRIRSGVQSLLLLIGDLLELSRAQVGELRMALRAVDVREVVRDAVDEHQAEARVVRHSISVTTAADLPLVKTDDARVRQILGNLLSNAIKYTPPGGRIEVRAELRNADGASSAKRQLAIDVSDSGPGIPADKLELVFDEFTRFDDSGKPGAGLGLAIARRVARLLDGDITVTSELGRGSCFTLWLRAS
jgi:signal transduction histidine kinase